MNDFETIDLSTVTGGRTTYFANRAGNQTQLLLTKLSSDIRDAVRGTQQTSSSQMTMLAMVAMMSRMRA